MYFRHIKDVQGTNASNAFNSNIPIRQNSQATYHK